MVDPSFGLSERYALCPFLPRLIALPQKLSVIETRLLLLSWYDREYGIRDHDHESTQMPWPHLAIGMHDDLSTGSRSYERKRKYITSRILHHTGMSWVDFSQLPSDECEQWFELTEELNKASAQQTQDLENSLSGMQGK